MAPSSNLRFILTIGIFLISFPANSQANGKAETVEKFAEKGPVLLVRLAQQEKVEMWKQEEENFKEMCKFLELDRKQTEKAFTLFETRCKEIKEIFGSVRIGELSQEKALRLNMESLKKHRDGFLSLLSKEQKARLKLWEKQQRRETRHG